MAQVEYDDIEQFLHCGRCLRENARPQQLEVGLAERGTIIVVWCRRHDIAVGSLRLAPHDIPAGCAGEGCAH